LHHEHRQRDRLLEPAGELDVDHVPARLVGARIYRTRLDLFDRWYQQHGRDVRGSVSALRRLMSGAEGDSAYARLERAVDDSALTRP
jgi:hypothetical protein